jgi:transmembrane 9 superfamily protein 3
VLPFGSIFIEMYFMFTAFWSYKFYYVYGFMLLVYLILSLVTICTTIVAVYFVLNAENYHWQWMAFSCAGSTSFYVFLYSIFYFFYKTQMTGLLQVSFYFGYMFLFCLSLFFMCGAVGTWGATIFVKKIYRDVKID